MRTNRRAVLASAGVLGVALLIALGANAAGAAPLTSGPLGDQQPPQRDVAWTTQNYSPQHVPLYLTPVVEDTWGVPVTIVRVTPVGVTVPGSVVVLGSLPFNTKDPAEHGPDGMDQVMLGLQEDPGAHWASPEAATGVTVAPTTAAAPDHQGRAFLVRITPDPVLETSVLHFDVEYTVGPLHFVTTAWGPLGTTVIFCGRDAPAPAADGPDACGPAPSPSPSG